MGPGEEPRGPGGGLRGPGGGQKGPGEGQDLPGKTGSWAGPGIQHSYRYQGLFLP